MPNWVDYIIIAIFVIYVWGTFRHGLLRLSWELAGLLVAFACGLKFYPVLEKGLEYITIPGVYARPISFLIIWFFVQIIFYFIGLYLSFYVPVKIKESALNIYLGLIPAICKGVIFVAVLLILLLITPISSEFKAVVSASLVGKLLIQRTTNIELKVEAVFSEDGSSGTLTSTAVFDQSSKLDFTTIDTSIDAAAETKMFEMVNAERVKAGVQPLTEDILTRNVARMKSRDMLIKGYFSHESPNGETLFSRLTSAHSVFISAAENIALAPTIDLAQVGLMNSPKHKANILDPSFTRMGVGVIDAKDHGLMVTQIFIK